MLLKIAIDLFRLARFILRSDSELFTPKEASMSPNSSALSFVALPTAQWFRLVDPYSTRIPAELSKYLSLFLILLNNQRSLCRELIIDDVQFYKAYRWTVAVER